MSAVPIRLCAELRLAFALHRLGWLFAETKSCPVYRLNVFAPLKRTNRSLRTPLLRICRELCIFLMPNNRELLAVCLYFLPVDYEVHSQQSCLYLMPADPFL